MLSLVYRLQELSIQKYCYRPAGSLLASVGLALCRACYRPFIALQELSIQKYCYRSAGSLLAIVGLLSAERAIVRLSSCRVRLFSCIAIALLALYWLSLVCSLQSVLSSVCRPAGSCLFSCIAIDMLALYIPAGDIALCRACYRPSIVLQGASIQMYCYRPASSLLPIVGLALCRAVWGYIKKKRPNA